MNSGFKFAQLELSKLVTGLTGTGLTGSIFAEVALSVLIANFNFELSDKEIVWNNAGVAYPSVGKESSKPEMPLKVSVIRP